MHRRGDHHPVVVRDRAHARQLSVAHRHFDQSSPAAAGDVGKKLHEISLDR